ncbi:MAG: flavin reductase family protein [Candidatus Saelkia tenebricola]|nr:flavin reductase family protein [Candidatus Saelkia tenebricola]
MKKIEVPLIYANRIINHGCVILVTSKYKDKSNIITLAWQMPVSHKPKLVSIAVHKKHFSHMLITKSKEFIINIPTRTVIDAIHFCGSVSGREIDKFRKTGFTEIEARYLNAPLIKECIGHMECRVKKIYAGGDHTIFLGEVLRVVVNEGVFDGKFLRLDNPRVQTLHHLGENRYMVSGVVIQAV